MNLQNYLLPAFSQEPDWAELLSDWDWLLPASYELWLVNRFGDAFIVTDDEAVHQLDIGAGTLTRVADSRGQFAALAEDIGTISNWLMIDAVNDLVERNQLLAEGQCYSYKVPPGLGGEYTLSNFEITDLHVHLSLHGQLFEQARRMKEGTRIGEVKIREEDR